jgi:hypothetical protein
MREAMDHLAAVQREVLLRFEKRAHPACRRFRPKLREQRFGASHGALCGLRHGCERIGRTRDGVQGTPQQSLDIEDAGAVVRVPALGILDRGANRGPERAPTYSGAPNSSMIASRP